MYFLWEIILNVLEKAETPGSAICAERVTDTVKQTGSRRLQPASRNLKIAATESDPKGSHYIKKTIERSNLWLAQTPQVFRRNIIEEAFKRAGVEGWSATDSAELVERAGFEVAVAEGAT